MRKHIRVYILFIFIIFLILVGIYLKNNNKSKEIFLAELPERYKAWLELPEEEKSKTIRPLAYEVNLESSEILKEKIVETNNQMTKSDNLELPDKYDLRTYSGVSQVKNQRQWNYCWAFAGTSSLESHLLNKTRTNMYENCTPMNLNLNPMHVGYSLAYNFANGVSNPYGMKSLDYGGNAIDNILYWTSGIGPVSTEEFDVTSEAQKINLPASEVLVQTEDIQVENALLFPNIDMQTANENEKLEYRQLIKNTLIANGAIKFSSMAPQKGLPGYNEENKCVYIESYEEIGFAPHAMLIVGWDDTFSKENFNNGYITGDKPSIDGAWIVQNSWGTGEGIGVDGTGYYYYSYEDYGLGRDLASVAETSTIDYDNVYQYNPSGEVRNSSGIYAANVFKKLNTEDEELTEIGFFNFYPNTTYSVYINPNGDDLSINNLECVKEYTDTDVFSEYFTLKLDEPIKLTGEKFAIIIKAESENANVNIPIQVNSHNSLSDEEVNIKENQSFISNDGKNWTDAKEQFSASVMIKAFTNNIEQTPEILNTVLDKDKVYVHGETEAILVTSQTRNITNKDLITYEIYNSLEKNVTDIFNISTSNNNSTYYADIVIGGNAELEGEYKLNVLYDGNIKGTYNFEIIKKMISSINVLKDEIYLQVNDTNKLLPKITVEPSEINDFMLQFTSQDENIASVTEEGVVTAKSLGETKIEIRSTDGGNITSTIKVKVVNLDDLLEGKGSNESPYLIKSGDDLNLIRADLKAYYKLNNDIDLTDLTNEGGSLYNDGKGWDPIGFLQRDKDSQTMSNNIDMAGTSYWQTFGDSDVFSGILDGNDKTISGLNINRPDENGVALFSILDKGTIKNLKIKDSTIKGYKYVASFASYMSGGKIENVSSYANIEGNSVLAGINSIASNNSIIVKTANRGNVIETIFTDGETQGFAGGITSVLNGSSISMTFNTGTVHTYNAFGSQYAGGITSLLIDGEISNSYNTGNIFAGTKIGGIVGEIFNRASIRNVYNSGIITGIDTNWTGDISGYIDAINVTINNAYTIESDLRLTGGIARLTDESNSVLEVFKKTEEELKKKETFVGFDFDSTWKIEENSMPLLRITENNKVAECIRVKSVPQKTSYAINKEYLDIQGLQVVLVYNDGTEEEIEITSDMVTGFDNTTLGDKLITITYQDYTTSFTVSIIKDELDSIGYGMKDDTSFELQYTEGEYFNKEDINIIAHYKSNRIEFIDIDDCIISNTHPLKMSDTSITISYTEENITKSTNINIKVYSNLKGKLKGNGTIESPYLIYTLEELNIMRENPLLNYKLMNDIDLTQATSENGVLYNNGKGWEVIGNYIYPFKGTLDGNGKKIIGLYSNASKDNYENAGLFECLHKATVKNLTIEDANLSGFNCAGIVADMAIDSNLYNIAIINCNIYAQYSAGGVATNVENCTINKCYNEKGSITSENLYDDARVGGIVGSIRYQSILNNCYNISTINNGKYAGGIAGEISNIKYIVTGPVEGKDDVKIETSYNIGRINCENIAGGICGNADKAKIINCYDVSDDVSAIGQNTECTINNVEEKSLEKLKEKSTFIGFDFENIWNIEENGTPKFRIFKYVKYISIKTLPLKTTYVLGENLDVTGGKITINYEDGSTKDIDLTLSMVSGFDKNKEGVQTVKVTYEGKETTITITNTKKEETTENITVIDNDRKEETINKNMDGNDNRRKKQETSVNNESYNQGQKREEQNEDEVIIETEDEEEKTVLDKVNEQPFKESDTKEIQEEGNENLTNENIFNSEKVIILIGLLILVIGIIILIILKRRKNKA